MRARDRRYEVTPHLVFPSAATFSPDGMRLAAGTPEGLQVYSTTNGAPVVSMCELTWQDTERCLSTRLLRASDGSVLHAFGAKLHHRPTFSRDGAWIVAGDTVVETSTMRISPLGFPATVAVFVAQDVVAAGDAQGRVQLLCPSAGPALP